MKKLFFSAWVCMALACACRQVPGYKLTGTIQGAQDGDTVKMFVFEDWNEVVLQKTVVKDGAFTFTGRQDTAAFRYITCIKNGTPLSHCGACIGEWGNSYRHGCPIVLL